MHDTKIYKTNYFTQRWTWTKRVFVFLFFIGLVIWWEINEEYWDFWWIKYVLFTALSIGLFLSPVDDITIDGNYFYHFRTSLWRSKSKVYKYDISTIKSIRCIGIHVPGITIKEMGYTSHLSTETNTVEMSFKDGTYKSLELGVYKKELLFYVSEIRERMS
jgi:hypothetical protein